MNQMEFLTKRFNFQHVSGVMIFILEINQDPKWRVKKLNFLEVKIWDFGHYIVAWNKFLALFLIILFLKFTRFSHWSSIEPSTIPRQSLSLHSEQLQWKQIRVTLKQQLGASWQFLILKEHMPCSCISKQFSCRANRTALDFITKYTTWWTFCLFNEARTKMYETRHLSHIHKRLWGSSLCKPHHPIPKSLILQGYLVLPHQQWQWRFVSPQGIWMKVHLVQLGYWVLEGQPQLPCKLRLVIRRLWQF